MGINVDHAVLADEAVALLYARKPQLVARYGPMGRRKCVDDTTQTVLYLCEALANNSYLLFREYIAWLKTLFESLNIDVIDIEDSLVCLAEIAVAHLAEPDGQRAARMLERARADILTLPLDNVCLITGETSHAILARAYLKALLEGDKKRAGDMILDHVKAGMPVMDIYLLVFQPTLREVGRLWHTNKITVADEHFVTAATQAIMAQLYPYIFTGES